MWKTISSKEIFHHPRLTLIEDEVLLPNGVKTHYLKYKDNGECAVTVIARRNDGHILLQKEFSYPSRAYLFQFPGGGVPASETPKKGANRELMEEAGLKARSLVPLGSYLTQNRRSKKRMYVFLGTKLIEQSRAPDAEEIIESFWFSEREMERLIATNKIVNCHVLAAWCLYTRKKSGRRSVSLNTKGASNPKENLARNLRSHRLFALMAAREAERVLPLFEKERPKDHRPRKAIQAIRAWAHGKQVLGMAEVRKLSLDAHAAARAARSEAATFAARAAGHAVATWHVPTHAMGAPIYAGKAMLAHKEKKLRTPGTRKKR